MKYLIPLLIFLFLNCSSTKESKPSEVKSPTNSGSGKSYNDLVKQAIDDPEKGHFIARMRMEIDMDGKTKKTNTGKLSGSWHMNIAGTGLMIFRDASVIFKDGKLTFDLDPKRMEMPGLLKLITEATTRLSDSGMEEC